VGALDGAERRDEREVARRAGLPREALELRDGDDVVPLDVAGGPPVTTQSISPAPVSDGISAGTGATADAAERARPGTAIAAAATSVTTVRRMRIDSS
jgi:hypothetical protein